MQIFNDPTLYDLVDTYVAHCEAGNGKAVVLEMTSRLPAHVSAMVALSVYKRLVLGGTSHAYEFSRLLEAGAIEPKFLLLNN